MFDISWGEMLLIGAAALIFIGPKELPATLRALGQMTGKVRRMAGEFRAQFDDAMREADIDQVKREFQSMDDAARGASSFNPIETIRNELKDAVAPKPADLAAGAEQAAIAAAPLAAAPMAAAPIVIEPDLPVPAVPPPVEFGDIVKDTTPAIAAVAGPEAEVRHEEAAAEDKPSRKRKKDQA
jgi:sec-independent protein translocase protein TatB